MTANPAGFDQYAAKYDEELARGVSLSGEGKDYFARGRVEWIRRCLPDERPERVLDYGCGTGDTVPLLREVLEARAAVGLDTSPESIAIARRGAGPGTEFETLGRFEPAGEFDLAYCNGVFHHIPLDQRGAAVRFLWDALRPGGWLAFWENNPWNPGTRLVMSRIPFDRDAITLSALTARRLLKAGGFEVASVHFLFVFPRPLQALRGLEPHLSRLPIGGQYQVLCRKPR
jgi:SAM-dependent methyltransferase